MLVFWKHGTSGDFATASNWNPAEVPGNNDNAIISAKGTYTVESSVNETVGSIAIFDKHATLLIDSASQFVDSFGGLNKGTIIVEDNSGLSVGINTTNSTLSNTGTIDIGNNSLLRIGQPGFSGSATISIFGGGNIDLSGGEIIGGFSGVTMLTDNTISGIGSIDFSAGGQEAHGTWINQGIVDASAPNGILSIGHVVVENSGILEATHGGTLNIIVAPVHNAAQGVIEAKGENSEVILGPTLLSGHYTNAGLIEAVHAGTLVINAAQIENFVDTESGTIKAGHDSTVILKNAIIDGGAVTVAHGGIIEAEQGGNTISGAAITNAGTIGAEGANLTIVGDINNRGILDANNGILVVDGTVSGGKATLEGTGEIDFSGASAASVTFAANSNAILKLDNPLTFTGTVSGFTAGDYIDLPNINFADNPTLSFSPKSHVLTVTDNITHVTDFITFKGPTGSFSALDDGNGGTLIGNNPAVATSHEPFKFAANLDANGTTAQMHDELIDFLHLGADSADKAASGQDEPFDFSHPRGDAINDLASTGKDAIDEHHAAALATHHFFV